MSKYLKIIEETRVESPCEINSPGFIDNSRGAHCLNCSKQVYDLKKYTSLEIFILFVLRQKHRCIKVSRNHRGKLITKQSCFKKGVRRAKKFFAWASVTIFNIQLNSVSAQEILDEKEQAEAYTVWGQQQASPIAEGLLSIIEGQTGLIVIILSALISGSLFIRGFLNKKKKTLAKGTAFLVIAISMLVLRQLVLLFFGEPLGSSL